MNFLMAFLVLSFIFCLCHDFVEGHARFVCPRPQSTDTGIYEQLPKVKLDGPCGLGNNVDFDAEYMETEPGPFTIVFEETQTHRDSPFRVSLHKFEDGNSTSESQPSCVLLDQIPHNNLAVITDHCKISGYPIGYCDRSKYYITLKIPDVNCDRCYLKLAHTEIDEEKDKTCGGENNTCKTFYSCANIKIRGSQPKKEGNLSSCTDYVKNLLGPWPYRPQYLFKTMPGDGGVEPLGYGRFDQYFRRFHLNASVAAKDRDSLQNISLVHTEEDGNDTVIVTDLFDSITSSDFVKDGIHVVWSDVSSATLSLLLSGNLTVILTFKDKEINGTIFMFKETFKLMEYHPLAARYSRQGWLSGPDFVGPRNNFPTAVEPHGQCAPKPSVYVAFLHAGFARDVHGVIAMSFLDEMVHVSLSLHNLPNVIQSIHAVGPELGGAPTLTVYNTSSNSVVHSVEDALPQIPFAGSVRFLKTVMILTITRTIDGELQRGMHSILRANNKVYGVAAFQFTKGRWLTYEVLLKDVASNVTSVTLEGPPTWGINGPMMYFLTDTIKDLQNGEWLIKGNLKDLNSEFFLALWKGWVKLVIKTDGDSPSIISGKLTTPGIWYCTQVKGAPCPLVNMLPVDTVFVDEGAEVVPAMGLGAFVLDRTDVLQYSILIENTPKKASGPLTATLTATNSNISITLILHPSLDRDKAYKAHGTSPESTQAMIEALASGHIRLLVNSSSIGKKPFNVSLPRITRDLCTSPKHFDIGADDSYWSVGNKAFSTVYTLVGDSLMFRYSSNDSVYLMASKEAYLDCEFTDATMIGGPVDNTTAEVKYELKKAAHLYFASELNCNSTPPLRVAVSVVQGVAPQTADLDNCGTSLFDIWRKQRLSKFVPPNPIGAAFGGIIAGLILLGLFVIWDRKVNQKKSGNLALFERF